VKSFEAWNPFFDTFVDEKGDRNDADVEALCDMNDCRGVWATIKVLDASVKSSESLE
jgi:hypothetical protein